MCNPRKSALPNALLPALALACLLASGCGETKSKSLSDRARKIARTTAGTNKQDIEEFVKEVGLPGLKRLLENDSAEGRMVAITGLGMLKGEREATELLIKFASGDDPDDAYWAIIALGHQGAPEAKEQIEKLMKSGVPRVRVGACLAIKEYGDESLYPLLDAAENDEDPMVQRAAQKAKLLIKEGQAVAPRRQ